MTSVLFNPYSNSGFCKFFFKDLLINKIIPIRNMLTRELISIALYHFYQISDKAPITKALLGTFITSHVALQIPMFSGLSIYLICLIPSRETISLNAQLIFCLSIFFQSVIIFTITVVIFLLRFTCKR